MLLKKHNGLSKYVEIWKKVINPYYRIALKNEHYVIIESFVFLI